MNNPNLALLLHVAIKLESLLDEVVFLGGCATGLLITDPAASPVRTTTDVDVITEIGSRAEYYKFSEKLRRLGFQEDIKNDAPLCRWIIDRIALDVMPTDSKILGFSNKWYRAAIQHAHRVALNRKISIQMVSAPYFVATKLEAFYGRGNGDYLLSHDLEDIIAVIDGRIKLIQEISSSEPKLKSYLAKEFSKLLAKEAFVEALPGHLPPDNASQARTRIIFERLRQIAQSQNIRSRTD